MEPPEGIKLQKACMTLYHWGCGVAAFPALTATVSKIRVAVRSKHHG